MIKQKKKLIFTIVLEFYNHLKYEDKIKEKTKMNIKFNKALFYLDKGKYEEGLELLYKAFEEEDNIYEKLEIKSCIMEVLYEMEEYEKVKECMEYIFQHTSEYDDSRPREIAEEIREEMIEKGYYKMEETENVEKSMEYISQLKNEEDALKGKEITEEIKGKVEDNNKRNKKRTGEKMKFWAIDMAKECTELGCAEKEYDKLWNYIFGYGESMTDKWDPTLELYVEEGNIEEGNIADSDVYRFSSAFFVINKKAKRIFDLLAKEDIEYLNLICKDANLVIVNPIRVIDCINMDTSKYKVYKGDKDSIQFFDKIYFKNGVIGDANLFIARHLENNVIICSDLLKETIEKNNIRGFCFKYLDECEI